MILLLNLQLLYGIHFVQWLSLRNHFVTERNYYTVQQCSFHHKQHLPSLAHLLAYILSSRQWLDLLELLLLLSFHPINRLSFWQLVPHTMGFLLHPLQNVAYQKLLLNTYFLCVFPNPARKKLKGHKSCLLIALYN